MLEALNKDTMVAKQIYQLISTLNLLGIQSTISGIRTEVAQTSIGLDFSQVSTHSTLKQKGSSYTRKNAIRVQ
ncbi:hypothetical protein [Bacillus sp. ISL-57]|uniref:hypothetical protein n=2 Tax=Bacillus TaxID=1386 RepID=UPI0028899BA3|nr:hypothetical protein [Bacillus sp. ISL-57]